MPPQDRNLCTYPQPLLLQGFLQQFRWYLSKVFLLHHLTRRVVVLQTSRRVVQAIPKTSKLWPPTRSVKYTSNYGTSTNAFGTHTFRFAMYGSSIVGRSFLIARIWSMSCLKTVAETLSLRRLGFCTVISGSDTIPAGVAARSTFPAYEELPGRTTAGAEASRCAKYCRSAATSLSRAALARCSRSCRSFLRRSDSSMSS